jgi:hypothetical protein
MKWEPSPRGGVERHSEISVTGAFRTLVHPKFPVSQRQPNLQRQGWGTVVCTGFMLGSNSCEEINVSGAPAFGQKIAEGL